jgi:hypothetical protein
MWGRRANLNEKETKAMIASLADMPESQLKGPIVFTLKGMAKVLQACLLPRPLVLSCGGVATVSA